MILAATAQPSPSLSISGASCYFFPTIYLAGPLFTTAEQAWLRNLKATLVEQGHEVCWPFELFKEGQISNWGPVAPRRIMERCRDALDKCSHVVAWIDGAQVDDGPRGKSAMPTPRASPSMGSARIFARPETPRLAADKKHLDVSIKIDPKLPVILLGMRRACVNCSSTSLATPSNLQRLAQCRWRLGHTRPGGLQTKPGYIFVSATQVSASRTTSRHLSLRGSHKQTLPIHGSTKVLAWGLPS